MSQRASGYDRIENDNYETPDWCTKALVLHMPRGVDYVWEPAAGSGRMVRSLKEAGYKVKATDIVTGQDFLKIRITHGVDAIITNPPYALATEFIEHALSLGVGTVAMLLRTDFDHAVGRRHLFADCKHFSKKLVLTRRIRWIEGSKGSPSFNHCWMIWSKKHRGAPTLAYDFQ